MSKTSNTGLGLKIRKVLIDYFKTQFLLMILVALIVWGIMAIVPNLHPIIEVLIAGGSFLVLSNLMDLFVALYLLEKTTKINPFLVFFSFFVGIFLFGIIGALFAVPIALVIKTIWEHYKEV